MKRVCMLPQGHYRNDSCGQNIFCLYFLTVAVVLRIVSRCCGPVVIGLRVVAFVLLLIGCCVMLCTDVLCGRASLP